MRVVPALDPAEERRAGLRARSEALSIQHFALEARENALGHRVVVAIAHAAHRGPHTHLPAALAALLKAEQLGVGEIARRMGRSPSTISRELRRNAETRGGVLRYRATVAQWKAERAAARPKESQTLASHHFTPRPHRRNITTHYSLICSSYPSTETGQVQKNVPARGAGLEDGNVYGTRA
jgi:hypothetical protein